MRQTAVSSCLRDRQGWRTVTAHVTARTVTGKDEDPDESLMQEVESLLDVKGEPKDHREMIISMVAAWAIDNPGSETSIDVIFPDHVSHLRRAAYQRRRKPFAALLMDVITLVRDEGSGLTPSRRDAAQQMVERMEAMGYQPLSAADAVSALVRERYSDLVG